MTQIAVACTASSGETREWGRRLGRLLRPGDLVNLNGDLGAGKTVFVKGIAAGLGHDPDEVLSPTFTLVREYAGEVSLYHLDIYRLHDPVTELEGIGIDSYFDPEGAVTAVEWGDNARELLPGQRIDVAISVCRNSPGGEGRRIVVEAQGMEKERVAAIREQLGERKHRGDDV